jgi:hypothetical protein
MRGRRLQEAALRLISINQMASRQRRSRQARGRRGTVRGSRSHVGLRPVAPMTLLLTRQYMKPSTSPLPIPSIIFTSTNPVPRLHLGTSQVDFCLYNILQQ